MLSPAPVWTLVGNQPEYVWLLPFGMVANWNWVNPDGGVKSRVTIGLVQTTPKRVAERTTRFVIMLKVVNVRLAVFGKGEGYVLG